MITTKQQQERPPRRGATVKRSRGRSEQSQGAGVLRACLRLVSVCLVVSLLGASVYFGKAFIDQATKRPIRSIGVEGAFTYISQQSISDLVTPMIVGGFLQSPLPSIKTRLEENPWIAQAVVSRRWPDELFIAITEEQPIARWGTQGFLNHTGELVKVDAPKALAHLPLLAGQLGQEKEAMQNYQQLAQMLRPYGLKVGEFYSDELYSWNVVLTNGLKITIGRDQTMEKIRRFLVVYDRELHKRLDEVAVVDLRYGNGLAVQWKAATADSEDTPSDGKRASAS